MRAPNCICRGVYRKLLLVTLVTVPNNGAKALLTLKLRHGFALLHVTLPPGVATVPEVEMMYPVLFTLITFCLLGRLKKSASSSTLYFSWKVKFLAMRMSTSQVMGCRKELRPRMSIRLVPPEPLMPPSAP